MREEITASLHGPGLCAGSNLWWPPIATPKVSRTSGPASRSVIGYLNTVGLKGKDPLLCQLVAQRQAV